VPRPRTKPDLQAALVFMHVNARTMTGLLLLVLLATTVLAGLHYLRDPYRFPLRLVKVEGDFRYLEKEQLQAVLAARTAGGFFTVDVARIRRAAEALPWVYEARVERRWPDILGVHVKEQEPVARWGKDGFVNRLGVSFFPEQAPDLPELPLLSGPAGHEQDVLEKFERVSRTLAPLGLRVTRVELDARRAWRLQLDNGLSLELGRVDTQPRLQRFVRSFPDVFAGRLETLQRVDLRYSNGFSVYWKQALDGRSAGTRS